MRHTKEVTTTTIRTTSLTCDCCKRTVDADDVMEFQEFQCITIAGGFGSVFGDGSTYELDLCQYCVKSLLSKYMRFTGNYITDFINEA